MKVLVFMSQFYLLNGAERLGVELAVELNKRGVRADIASLYTEDLPGVGEATRELLSRGIPSVHFLGMAIHPPISGVVQAIMRLRRLLKEQEYDIVETSVVSPTVVGAWAALGMRTRHVAGIHQVYLRERENGRHHQIMRASLRFNRGTRFYAISDSVASHWVRYAGTPPGRIRKIYNGIPDDCFEAIPDREGVRRELGIPKHARLAIYVGRLASYKGIDTLIDAVGPVLDQMNTYLLCVGEPDMSIHGTREMLERADERISNEGWRDRVRFLGYRKDIPRLLASSDVLTHPTRTEGFGLTLVEAMAAGIPVVTTDIEGIPEVLEGTDSLMVPPDAPKAFRDAFLTALRRTPAETAAAIEKGRKRAEDFRMSTRVSSMINYYEAVLHGRA